MPPSDDIAVRFRDVERSGPLGLAAFLERLAANPSFALAKRRSVELLALRAGGRAVDVGCGLGDEVRAMAALVGPEGSATGVDASGAMLGIARDRPDPPGAPRAQFLAGDAEALPLPDAAFDAVRTERTLQHVADPGRALDEMVRVTAPGGRISVAEPDWDTFMADVAPLEVTRLLCRRRADAIRNPDIGRRLPRLLARRGLREVTVELVATLVSEPALAEACYELGAEARRAVAGGVLDPAAGARWLAALAGREAEGSVLCSVTMVLAAGRRP